MTQESQWLADLMRDAHAMFPDGAELWVQKDGRGLSARERIHLDREAVERFSVTLARIDAELVPK